MNIAALLEKRAAKADALKAFRVAADAESRDFTDAELATIEAARPEIETLERQLRAAETVAKNERRADAVPVDGERRSRDLAGYSIAKGIQESMNGRLTGLEAEWHQELSRGRETRGFMVPTEILMETRVLKTTTPGAGPGSNLIGREIMPLHEHARPALLVESMGATVMRDVVGNLVLPYMPESGQVGWVAEHTNVIRSDPKFTKTELTPRTSGGEYEVSRRMLLQSSVALEELLRRDLGNLQRQALDKAAISGTGGVEPLGILNTVGVVGVPAGLSFSDTTADMIAALELDDLTGSRGFLGNPGVMQTARKTKDGDGHVIPLTDLFHGERVASTTQVGTLAGPPVTNALIYGQWSELVIAYWSGVDILVNPYHVDVASKGGVLIHTFLDCDVAVRTPNAFVVSGIA